MHANVPSSRPKLTQEAATLRLTKCGVDVTRPALLGVRGYYLDTMGVVRVNDIGIYDDAIFLVAPEFFAAYNANTDPSVKKPRVATLQCGVWLYQLGTHNMSKPPDRRYRALVQATNVTVNRQNVALPDTGRFGINIHRGSMNSTSSEGCQTIYPTQWDGFIASVADVLRRSGATKIPYALVDDSAT